MWNGREDQIEWETDRGFAQIDYMPFTSAIHRLNGIVTPASAAYSAPELEHQIRSSGSRALFTCVPLLDVALKAAKAAGIPDDAIFILPVPGVTKKTPYPTIDDLVAEGEKLPEVEQLKWIKGQGARQVAFLCYSSGTSGLPVSFLFLFRPRAPRKTKGGLVLAQDTDI